MKFAPAFVLLAVGADAFQAPTMTFAVGKGVKKVAKAAKAAPKKAAKAVKKATTFGTVPSKAIPGEVAPALLDGSLPGDVGFDPCFLSTKQADLMAGYFNGLFENKVQLDGLSWFREAELMHGRIAQLAVLGMIFPGIAHFPSQEWAGLDAFSYTNPLEAYSKAPSAALFQIFLFMIYMEFRRINFIFEDGSNYVPGASQRWGQGEGYWNPFGLNYTPEQYREKQIQETKHGRLAMIGFFGTLFQANASGESVADQLGAAFSVPEYYAKAGYFLPEGI